MSAQVKHLSIRDGFYEFRISGSREFFSIALDRIKREIPYGTDGRLYSDSTSTWIISADHADVLEDIFSNFRSSVDHLTSQRSLF